MRMTGAGGEVRYGGRVAAVLARWTYEGTRDAWTVTAATERTDPYWLAQNGRPHTLLLHLNRDGTRRMRWHVQGVSPTDTELTITGTGAPEYA